MSWLMKLSCAARSTSRQFVVDDEVFGERGPPDVQRVFAGVVRARPIAAGFDEVDVVGVLRVAAPRISHVAEVVGAEYVSADAPSLVVAGLHHLLRTQA